MVAEYQNKKQSTQSTKEYNVINRSRISDCERVYSLTYKAPTTQLINYIYFLTFRRGECERGFTFWSMQKPTPFHSLCAVLKVRLITPCTLKITYIHSTTIILPIKSTSVVYKQLNGSERGIAFEMTKSVFPSHTLPSQKSTFFSLFFCGV